MTIEVRRLKPEDVAIWTELRLEALARHPLNFLTTYAEEAAVDDAAQRDMLAKRQIYAVFVADAPAGILALDPEKAAAVAHRAALNAVYVRDEYQGAGAAQALLDHVVQTARAAGIMQLELSVMAENPRALRFYERNGFTVWGRLPRTVKADGRFHDDLFMYRPLDV